MKFIKNLFVTLGVIFVLVIGVAGYLFKSSNDFKEQNESFVKSFSINFSKTWNVSDVSDFLTNDMIAQSNTPNAIAAINTFQQFGEIIDISDFEIGNYNSNASGSTFGTFTFKAKFKNGNGIVTVIVRELDGKILVHGFNIDPIGDISQPKERKA